MKIKYNFNNKSSTSQLINKNKGLAYFFCFLMLLLFGCANSENSSLSTSTVISSSSFTVAILKQEEEFGYSGELDYGTVSINGDATGDFSIENFTNDSETSFTQTIEILNNKIKVENGIPVGNYSFDVVFKGNGAYNGEAKKTQTLIISKREIDANNLSVKDKQETATIVRLGTSAFTYNYREFTYGTIDYFGRAAEPLFSIENVKDEKGEDFTSKKLIKVTSKNEIKILPATPALPIGTYTFDIVIEANSTDPNYKGRVTSSQTFKVGKTIGNNDYSLKLNKTEETTGYSATFKYGAMTIFNGDISIDPGKEEYKFSISETIQGPSGELNNNDGNYLEITKPDEIQVNPGLDETGEYTFALIFAVTNNFYQSVATNELKLNIKKIEINSINDPFTLANKTSAKESGYSQEFTYATITINNLNPAITSYTFSIGNLVKPDGDPLDNSNNQHLEIREDKIIVKPGLNDEGDYTFDVILDILDNDPKYQGQTRNKFTLNITSPPTNN